MGVNKKIPLTAATNNGSRFDILNDDVDVPMMDSGGRASHVLVTEVQNTEKIALIDITNQSSTSKVPTKNPSQSSKKAVKKGKKKMTVLQLPSDIRKGVEYYKKSFGLDTDSASLTPNADMPDLEELDNAGKLLSKRKYSGN
ncbi:hypothetical protein Q3G72_025583 [Acer saccharum]|nr:hypothetical protein Q3G72_025583 [Acer saccharum]